MATPPFLILVGGQPVTNYTEATLTRTRDEGTGELTFQLFWSSTPASPVATNVTPGAEIQVYLEGQLAFNGLIDTRAPNGRTHRYETARKHHDTSTSDSKMKGGGRSVSITADHYIITVTARGKTKDLVDSSHAHPTGFMPGATGTQAITTLAQPFGIEVQDTAGLSNAIDRTFTDGGFVIDEIHAIARSDGASIYESAQGQLMIASHGDNGSGDPLILGQNVLAFTAENTEQFAMSQIKIKGNRTGAAYGKDAITKPVKLLNTGSVNRLRLYSGAIDGDGTDARLTRAAKNEKNARDQASKTITVEVFGVAGQSGPWDLNKQHVVQIPPEGIFDTFVVTKLVVHVSTTEFKTTLTLAPLGAVDNDDSGSAPVSDSQAQAQAARASYAAQIGVASIPDLWSIGAGSFAADPTAAIEQGVNAIISYPPATIVTT